MLIVSLLSSEEKSGKIIFRTPSREDRKKNKEKKVQNSPVEEEVRTSWVFSFLCGGWFWFPGVKNVEYAAKFKKNQKFITCALTRSYTRRR